MCWVTKVMSFEAVEYQGTSEFFKTWAWKTTTKSFLVSQIGNFISFLEMKTLLSVSIFISVYLYLPISLSCLFCHGKHLKAGLELLRKNPPKPVHLLVSPYLKKAVSRLFQWRFLIVLSSADQLSNGMISTFSCCRERKKKSSASLRTFLKVALPGACHSV